MWCAVCGARPVSGANGRCFACSEASPAWPGAYRSPAGLGVAAGVMLGVSGVVALLAVAVDIWRLVAGDDLLVAPDGTRDEPLDLLALFSSAVTGLFYVALVGTAVVFICWLRRVRANADLLVPNGHQHGAGWVIGAWITPFVQFWFPWRLVVDCWQASGPVDADGQRRPVSQSLVSLWWAAWLGSILVTRVQAMMERSGGVDSPGSALGVELVADGLRVVAAVLAVLVVRRLTAMQESRFALVARLPFQPPVPAGYGAPAGAVAVPAAAPVSAAAPAGAAAGAAAAPGAASVAAPDGAGQGSSDRS